MIKEAIKTSDIISNVIELGTSVDTCPYDTAAGADGLDELPVVPCRVSNEVLSIG